MITKQTRSLLAYSFLKGVGRKYLKEISDAFETDYNQTVANIETRFDKKDLEDAFNQADNQIAIADTFGHQIISKLDIMYPDSLKCTHDAPVILFCSGNLELLKSNSISIIGTREPTSDGQKIAARITTWFTANGWTITSGLALGIDTIAHQFCLKLHGSTIAVLAHGLEKIYPATNKNLATEIVENNGLLISEYKYRSFVAKSNFVERDRIQAALSKAVLLVQSGVKGGSLHASRAALNYKRLLIVVGQSENDIKNSETKIQANLALLSNDNKLKAELLGIQGEDIKNIIPLKSKESYHFVNNKINEVIFNCQNNNTSNKLL